MRKLKQFILFVGLVSFAQMGFAQMAVVKSFDYALLENKKLYLSTYEASASYVKKMKKKGKFEEIADAEAKAERHNKRWEEAMAESSYDATDYEFRAYDSKKLIKDKDQEAIFFYYLTDQTGNRYANLVITHPRRKIIARTIINGLNLNEKNDIRLMVNLLNESLNNATEIQGKGKEVTGKNYWNKYKEGVISFYDDMKDKMFLVPKSEHKKKNKAAERNADLKQALRKWRLSEYTLTTVDEIEKKRVEGDPDTFYWRDFPVYSQIMRIPVTFHYNVLLSSDSDDVLFTFLGKKRITPDVLEKIQKKIKEKASKYRKQLEQK